MRVIDVIDAVAAAKEFIKAAEDLQCTTEFQENDRGEFSTIFGNKYSGLLKARGLILIRALSDMRKTYGAAKLTRAKQKQREAVISTAMNKAPKRK